MIQEQHDIESPHEILQVEAILVEEEQQQPPQNNTLFIENATVVGSHKQPINRLQKLIGKFIACLVLLILVLIIGSYFT